MQGRRKNPYGMAAALAIVVFMLCAPEINDGKTMEPTLHDGNALVVSKTSYSIKRKMPERGKVIIMEKLAATEVSEDNLIARVIALPGDTVEIKDGKVLVNDKEYITEAGIKGAPGEMEKIKLEGYEVFLLSDNRDAKVIDSRNPKLGPVNMRDIKGNVLVKLWPLSDLGVVK